jgi:hypothetical protein
MLLAYAEPPKIGGMTMLYRRPAGAARLSVEPLLASGYDGSIWPPHDGLIWPHQLAVVGGGMIVSA